MLFYSPSLSIWLVLGIIYENQYSSCSRYGLLPSTVYTNISWSYSLFKEASTSFGKIPQMMSGCCVNSMWCDNSSCYAHSFNSQYYMNYGVIPLRSQLSPVYSCEQKPTVAGDVDDAEGTVI